MHVERERSRMTQTAGLSGLLHLLFDIRNIVGDIYWSRLETENSS